MLDGKRFDGRSSSGSSVLLGESIHYVLSLIGSMQHFDQSVDVFIVDVSGTELCIVVADYAWSLEELKITIAEASNIPFGELCPM